MSVLVERYGFTNWGTNVDLTSGDVFSFSVSQAVLSSNIGNIAIAENQEQQLYLLQKIIQKNQAIQSELNIQRFLQ